MAGEHVQVGLVLGVYFVRQVAIASASEAMSTGLAEPGKNCQGLQPGNKASNPKCFKKIDLKSPLTLTLARHTFLAELRNCSSRMAMLEGRGLYYSLFQYNHTYKKLLYFVKKIPIFRPIL